MAGYIGKVAAVLSVNTSDVPGKIQSGFVAPMDRALRQVENTLRNTNRSITKSFDDIYTQGQKVARARAFAAAGAVKGFDDVDFGKRLKIRDDISEPVKRLATAIEKTSGTIRGQFEPAVVAVQAAAQSLFDRMATDAASVTQGEISAMISKVESLASAFQYATTASERMAEGWANMNRAGAAAAEGRRRDSMFAGLGAAGLDNLRDLQRMRDFEAMVGQSSPVNWQTPWRRGLGGPAGPVTTGVGASSSIANEGLRTILRPGLLQEVVARQYEAATPERVAAGMEGMSRIGREAAEKRRIDGMFAAAGAQAAAMRAPPPPPSPRDVTISGMVGASSDVDMGQRGVAMINATRQRVLALKAAVSALPAEMQEGFIPAIRDAERELRRMAQAPDLASGRINALRADVDALGQSIGRASTAQAFLKNLGGAGTAGLRLGLDERALQGAQQQMLIMLQTLGRVSQEARGPALAAIERFRVGAMNAFQSGQIDAEEMRLELGRLREEAVRATARATRSGVGGLRREVNRAGDVGRGGADKFALALQQGIFAIDDFTSATGNMGMKLRAVQNNLTQMAFILGGLGGLFAGLAISIGAQAILWLSQWEKKSEEAEKQSKALTDALSRQKDSVEELARAYQSLGKDILQATLSQDAAAAEERRATVTELTKTQQDARRQAFGATNPFGFAANARVEELQAQLEKEPDFAKRELISAAIADERRAAEQQFSATESAARGIAAGSTPAAMAAKVAELESRLRDSVQFTETFGESEQMTAETRRVVEQLSVFRMAVQIAADDAKALGLQAFGGLQDRIQEAQKSLAALGDGVDATHLQSKLDAIGREMASVATASSSPQEMRKRVRDIQFRAAGVLEDSATFVVEENQAKKDRELAEKARRDREELTKRGADLIASPNQRAVAAFRKDLEAAALAAAGPNRQTLMSQFFANRAAEVAPLLSQFAQERSAAAMAQYTPALQAADVSTMEGQRELNRLLRGEDSGKDVSLDELKKQTDLLGQMVEIAQREQNVVVDF